MKITQEVREFARLNPTPLVPSEVEGRSPERAADAEAGMEEMSKRFHEAGSELYLPAEEAAESEPL
jgi:phosphomethylpyrimidine synthase